MNTRDAYADWDAAYVLGALSAVERREFEDHLSSCVECRGAVADLAGVPGLLAQVSTGEVLALDLPPEGGAPSTFAHEPVRRTPPRRWLVPLAAAAAALVVGAAGGYAVSATSRSVAPRAVTSSSSGSAAPFRLAFSPVQPSTMTAIVDVVPAGMSTRVTVECQYARATAAPGPGKGADYSMGDYAVWVVERSGRATELREWTARPGIVMRPGGVAQLPYSQIGRVEIRRVDDGQTVMRAVLT